MKCPYVSYICMCVCVGSFPGGLVVKHLTAGAGDASSIPTLKRSPLEEMATCSSILAWKIPWTEEPGGLQAVRLQRVGCD